MTVRCAVYFAPHPKDPLGQVGNAWLGRNPATGEACAQPTLDTIASDRLRKITASPRRYGLHATLKAPFELAAGRTIAQLDDAIVALAAARDPIAGLRLTVSELSGFLALTLSETSRAVENLASDCVRGFDPFRAPLRDEDLRRRRQAELSNFEDALLLRWGYPYVMEAFRFHITLTGRLPTEGRAPIKKALQRIFQPILGAAFAIDGIALFLQEGRDRPFHMVRRYTLGSGAVTSFPMNESIDRPTGPTLENVITSSPQTR